MPSNYRPYLTLLAHEAVERCRCITPQRCKCCWLAKDSFRPENGGPLIGIQVMHLLNGDELVAVRNVLVNAPPGFPVYPKCGNPACIRRSHLVRYDRARPPAPQTPAREALGRYMDMLSGSLDY